MNKQIRDDENYFFDKVVLLQNCQYALIMDGTYQKKLDYQRVAKSCLPKSSKNLPSDPDEELVVEGDVDDEGRVVDRTFLLLQGELKPGPETKKDIQN